jgi:hypothetical protein
MKDKLKKVKAMVKQYAPIIATASATAITVIACTRILSNKEWNMYVLTQEQRDYMAVNENATVSFPEQRVFITGNPNQDM